MVIGILLGGLITLGVFLYVVTQTSTTLFGLIGPVSLYTVSNKDYSYTFPNLEDAEKELRKLGKLYAEHDLECEAVIIKSMFLSQYYGGDDTHAV